MNDINKLVAMADKEQKEREQLKFQGRRGSDFDFGRKYSKLCWIVLVITLIVAVFSLARPFLPISEDVAQSELKAVLDAAQSSVEEYLRVNGRLPDRLPSPALRSMVRFEKIGKGYRLSASLNGLSLSHDQHTAQSGNNNSDIERQHHGKK